MRSVARARRLCSLVWLAAAALGLAACVCAQFCLLHPLWVQVFVMVADPQGQILECKDYLSPIVTPHEAMLAFTPGAEWAAAGYRLDFDGVLQVTNSPEGAPCGEGGVPVQ